MFVWLSPFLLAPLRRPYRTTAAISMATIIENNVKYKKQTKGFILFYVILL